MKAIEKYLKVVALLFATLMLFQSCAVYKSASVTLDEASKSNTKVRVKTFDNQTLKFDRIEVVDNKIIGINLNNKGRRTTLIERDNIEKIQLKDKVTTTTLVIVISVAAIIISYSSLNELDSISASN